MRSNSQIASLSTASHDFVRVAQALAAGRGRDPEVQQWAKSIPSTRAREVLKTAVAPNALSTSVGAELAEAANRLGLSDRSRSLLNRHVIFGLVGGCPGGAMSPEEEAAAQQVLAEVRKNVRLFRDKENTLVRRAVRTEFRARRGQK
jgi:hypothetical protein